MPIFFRSFQTLDTYKTCSISLYSLLKYRKISLSHSFISTELVRLFHFAILIGEKNGDSEFDLHFFNC